MNVESILEAEGHLVDSQILTSVFDAVIRHDSAFEVLSFDIGRTNEDYSRLRLKVSSPDQPRLSSLLEELLALGCHPLAETDVTVRPADKDGCAPEDFYSTTNHRTVVRHDGRWIEVGRQRMDAVIIVEDGTATAASCATCGAAIPSSAATTASASSPEFRERDRHGFAFMTNEISSERRVEVSIAKIAAMMREIKRDGGRIVFVTGPVAVHTGGTELLQRHRPQGLRERGAVGQRAGRPRRRARAVRHVARRRPRSRLTGQGRPPQSHAGDQHRQSRRRHQGRGRLTAS